MSSENTNVPQQKWNKPHFRIHLNEFEQYLKWTQHDSQSVGQSNATSTITHKYRRHIQITGMCVITFQKSRTCLSSLCTTDQDQCNHNIPYRLFSPTDIEIQFPSSAANKVNYLLWIMYNWHIQNCENLITEIHKLRRGERIRWRAVICWFVNHEKIRWFHTNNHHLKNKLHQDTE